MRTHSGNQRKPNRNEWQTAEVVAEGMGIGLQPDTMKQFRDLADPARIVEVAREVIDAGPYTADEVAAVLPFLFRQERLRPAL